MNVIKNIRLINKVLIVSTIFSLILATLSLRVLADTQYLTTEQFLNEHFSSDVIKPSKLWLAKTHVQHATKIIGYSPTQRVLPYWKLGNKTAWVLEDIGKVELITAGFIIENGKISNLRVLTYRESRGAEVRYKAFLKQFFGAASKKDSFLDHHIDGISGATLSVRAMKRMARLALYYDQLSSEE